MRGTVQDSAGAKLPGVTVSASTTPVITAETDPNGAFSFPVTHSGSLTFTLTMEKACYEAAPPKRVTLTNNTSHDTGITTLSLKPKPTEESDRYTFTQKPDGSYKLTVKECVTDIPESEFSASSIRTSPIIQRLAGASGKAIGAVLTEIELSSTLKTIGSRAFIQNRRVTGNLTIPKNVGTIGDRAFRQVGLDNFSFAVPTAIASSQAPLITFESGSRLTSIGQAAFELTGSKRTVTLPDSLETIKVRAFRYFTMPPSPLVIPEGVQKIGNEAFEGASGITGVTIRSTNLNKDATDPPLGTNLFGRASDRESTITTIELPLEVYRSYLNTSGTPRSELDAIFGSEITTSPNGYQNLEGTPHPTE